MSNDATAAHAPAAHAHPGAKQYIGIAVVLFIITAIEIGVFYVPAMKPVLAPVLITLSVLKFALVAMFYMHLKFDDRLFTWLFVAPMCIMAGIVIALLKIFGK